MAKPDPHEPITRQMLNEAIDAILEGVGSMVKDLRGRFDGMDKRFDKVDGRLDGLEVGQSYLQDQVTVAALLFLVYHPPSSIRKRRSFDDGRGIPDVRDVTEAGNAIDKSCA